MREVNQRELRERYDYHPDGYLINKIKYGNCPIGKRIGTLRKDGYEHCHYKMCSYTVHQLIYAWHYGYIPYELDHINRVRNDNRIENLREVTKQENAHNTQAAIDNGGVRSITIDGKRVLTELGKRIMKENTALRRSKQ